MKKYWILVSISLLILLMGISVWLLAFQTDIQKENGHAIASKSNTECFETYKVTYVTGAMEMMGSQPMNGLTSLKGVLYARHWQEGEEKYTLFLANDMLFNGVDSKKYDAVYEHIFVAKRDQNGLFETLYFDNATAKADESLLSGLILPFQSANQNGTYEEQDTTGHYVAEYTSKNNVFHKRKLSYDDVNISNASIPLIAEVERSTAEFTRDTCWVSSYKGEERIRLLTRSEHQLFVASTFHFSLEKIETPSYENPLMKYKGLTFAQLLSLLHQGPKATVSVLQKVAAEEKLQRASKRQISTDQMINDIVHLKKSIQEYALYLQTHPKQLSEMIAMILNGEITENSTMYLVELLAHTGTPQAQSGLLQIANSTAQSNDTRVRALVAFSSLRSTPTDETLEALFGFAGGLDDEENAELASVATLSLGSIAAHISAANPEIKEDIMDRLNQRLNDATTASSQRAYLLSLANGKPDEIDTIETFLASDEMKVRQAAIVLLANASTDLGVETLLSYQREETNVGMRAEVFKRLAMKQDLSKAQLQDVVTATLAEENPQVRYRMIEVIGKNAQKDRSLHATLKTLQEKETNTNNIKKILQYL
ncbi:MAG: hypothetical protein RL113_1258 [Pseudomonadota bacterium]|jgi:hypothetical protein